MYKKLIGTIQIILGILIALTFLIGFLVGFDPTVYESDTVPVMITCFILLLLGLFIIYRGYRNVKKPPQYVNEYINLILNQNVTAINDIAIKLNKDGSTVEKELQTIIAKGYLPNAYIDHQYSMVVVSAKKSTVRQMGGQTNNNPTQAKPTTLNCKNCGASNVILPGKPAECEFCGSPLK